MGVIVKIKGDFRGVDVRILESYLQSLVTQATQSPVARVVSHNVVKTDASMIGKD